MIYELRCLKLDFNVYDLRCDICLGKTMVLMYNDSSEHGALNYVLDLFKAVFYIDFEIILQKGIRFQKLPSYLKTM